MNFRNITAELDDIANQIQKKGDSCLAGQIDLISNSLDRRSQQAAKSPRKADQAQGLSMPGDGGGGGEEPPPGSGDADEAGHADSFEATEYHKVPVGNDSMSRYLKAPSPADILNRLDFAQEEGEINIQASKKKADHDGGDFDPADPLDPYSTAGLPETGDEEAQPPNDVNQEGDDLEFFGNEPPGSLHMPVGRRETAKIARQILSRAAAEIVVDEPEDLHKSEPGEDVERDQSLGGKGGPDADEEVYDEEEMMDMDYEEDEGNDEDEEEEEMMDMEDEDYEDDEEEMMDMEDEDYEDEEEEDMEAGAYSGKEYASRKSPKTKTRTASRKRPRGQSRIRTTVQK